MKRTEATNEILDQAKKDFEERKGTVEVDLNEYINKAHIRMLEKFKADLEAFRKETEAEAAELYEDANTSFTLANIRVENGCLVYEYDGREEVETMVWKEEDDPDDENYGGYYYEEYENIAEQVKFWRKCLNRAKRYWSMSPDKLDKIQDGVIEDVED